MTADQMTRRGLLRAAATAALLPAYAPAETDPRVYADFLEAELRRTYRRIDPHMDVRLWVKWIPDPAGGNQAALSPGAPPAGDSSSSA